jgi:selenocysteine lyase/cysteine desulfurase
MDYLVVSTYKMFGPHAGFLWGRRDLLQGLPTFREDFLPNVPPEKIEAGTTVHENIAGVAAAIDYLDDLSGGLVPGATNGAPRRDRLARAMHTIRHYEHGLAARMLDVMLAVPGLAIHGVTDPARLESRVPTFCFNIDGHAPPDVSDRLAAANIGIRHGNMYAPRLMVRLGVPVANRVSLVHYNTLDEIDRFGQALHEIANS